MKSLVLGSVALAAFLVGGSALADRPLTCKSQNGKYTLIVNTTAPLGAHLTVDGQSVQFGDLECHRQRAGLEAWMECKSPGVADAGYRASVYQGDENHVVYLKAVTFAGEEDLGVLNCDL